MIISFAILKKHITSWRILRIEAESYVKRKRKKVLICRATIEYDEGRELLGIDLGDFDEHAFSMPSHLIELQKVKRIGDGIYRGAKLYYDFEQEKFILEGDGRWKQ